MKGITPVIAVILLLLVTVSLVGFASVWFTRIWTTSAAAVENKTQKLLTANTIMIENAKGTVVDLRNTGSTAISGAEIYFYVNDVRVQASCPISIMPNIVVTCNLVPPANCPPGSRLRATVSGWQDAMTCR